MKPRLKPTRDGSLKVIQRGLNPWGELSAQEYIQDQYGSLSAFAARYRFPYAAVRAALRSPAAADMPGTVSKVRLVLGLSSTPVRITRVQTKAGRGRRQQ